MGFSDLYELVKEAFEGNLTIKALLPVLTTLAILGSITFRKRIKKTVGKVYGFIRQDSEINQLKDKIRDIRLRLYAPLYQLETEDEEFKEKVEMVLGKLQDVYENKAFPLSEVEYLTQEIESLSESYHEAISEIRRLVQTISDDLDRADQLALTRDERIDSIMDEVLPQEQTRTLVQENQTWRS
ncbi:MAG: hypothetical protein AAF703_17355 [Cyanobacteria bacterium P01_D01_bin.105]